MSNPAEELRRAREAAGLSLEDVERKIRVQSRYLKDIEEGDHSALPGRSYAPTRSVSEFLRIRFCAISRRNHRLSPPGPPNAPCRAGRSGTRGKNGRKSENRPY